MNAFDGVAEDYDRSFTHSILGGRLRETIWRQLEEVFRDGERVLDLGCGTGEDAVWLARRGVSVTAVDASPVMISIARRKAEALGVSGRIRFEHRDLLAFARAGRDEQEAPFDGGLSNFGALNALPTYSGLAGGLADRIAPGGRLAVVVMGPLCPWEWLWFGARGRLGTASRRLRRAAVARLADGVEMPVQYPTPRRLGRELRPYFHVRRTVGIGVTVPPTFAEQWAARRPGLIDRLTRLDRRIGPVFPATWMNDHYLMLLERVDAGAGDTATRRPDHDGESAPASVSFVVSRRRTQRASPRRTPVLAARDGYDLWAPEYSERMNPLQRLEADLVERLLPVVHNRIVLDVGCGKGRLSALALRHGARMTVGADLSAVMLRAAKNRAAAAPSHWTQGEAVALPFQGAAFDVVCCALTLGHVADLASALAELARVVRPGGSLLVSGFHPEATAHGWQRTFVDPASGRTFAIEQFPHPLGAYRRYLEGSGIDVETLEERRYRGVRIVFALRARRSRSTCRGEPQT